MNCDISFSPPLPRLLPRAAGDANVRESEGDGPPDAESSARDNCDLSVNVLIILVRVWLLPA